MKRLLTILLLFGCSVKNEYKYNVAHLTEIDPEKAMVIIRDSLNKYPACSKGYSYWLTKYKEIK